MLGTLGTEHSPWPIVGFLMAVATIEKVRNDILHENSFYCSKLCHLMAILAMLTSVSLLAERGSALHPTFCILSQG